MKDLPSNLYLPVLWIEADVKLAEDESRDIVQVLSLPRTIKIVTVFGVLASLLLVILSLLCLIKLRRRNRGNSSRPRKVPLSDESLGDEPHDLNLS